MGMDTRKHPKECSESLIEAVLSAAFRVHTELGPGLLETIYENALVFELQVLGIHVEQQLPVSISYRGHDLGTGFRVDLFIEKSLLIELKTVEQFSPIHLAQVLSYLKLLNVKRGFLLNFNTTQLKHGIKRISI